MLLALALLSGPAQAYESETQDVELSDTATLFAGSTVDTDWVPSGSPITVRFQIEPDGGAAVDMAGAADLSWPEGLNLLFTGEPGTGALTVDAALDAVTSVRFDVFGYSWESEIDRRGVSVTGESTFDPFLLDGAATDSVSVETAGDESEVVNYSLDVFAGVSLEFTATLQPSGSTTFHGVGFWVDDSEITTEGETAAVTASGTGTQPVEATFVGGWASSLDLTITPTASVCIPVYGCVDLASFDIPLPLASDDFEQAFPAIDLEFPLPVLQSDVTTYDFGEVMVGDLANLNLPLSNLGELDLEGELGVTGSTYFTLFPEAFYAAPGMEDGVVVTFAPESEGDFSGTILLSSNDPWQPLQEISIIGTGVLPEEDVDTGVPYESEGKEVKTCGCASANHGVSGLLPLALLAAALARRSAQRKEPVG